MHTIRAFLTSIIGLSVTVFAFAVAATFSFAVIVLVAFAAVTGIAVVKLSPAIRSGFARLQFARRGTRIWNDGNGVIVDA